MKLLTLLFLVLTVSFLRSTAQTLAPDTHPPYLVSIQRVYYEYGGLHYHSCAGALISPFWVVTSASCVHPLKARPMPDYVIVAGSATIDGEDNRQEIPASNSHQYAHPDFNLYNLTTSYDIALFQADAPFTFNEHVQPLRLPNKGEVPKGNAILSGWDKISNSSRNIAVSVIDNAECEQYLEDIAAGDSKLLSSSSNICSGPLDGSSGTCFYDKGSPLVQDNVLVGIATWGAAALGVDCGTVDVPSIYTEISAYIDFIEQHAVDLAWCRCGLEKHTEF